MTAVTNFFWWALHLPPKADTWAKFQLSRLIFIFISCQQLLTVVDSWWQLSRIFLDGIFIYPLKLIPVPNFSSLGWFSFSSVVNSFWQLLTADDSCHKFFLWDLHLPPKADTCAKFQLSRLLGGSARECDAQTHRRTDRRTDIQTDAQTPGEDSANSALLRWC